MALGILIIVAAIAGFIYGIAKKNQTVTIASFALLVLLLILWVVYSYLYSQNPY